MGRHVIELAPQIFRMPTFPFDGINSFCFVEDDGSVTLVDCGLKGAPCKLVAALAELGKTPSDVRRIVLTHAHADHAGGAAKMRRTTAAPLAVHDADAAYLRSGQSPPRESRLGKVLAMLPGGGFRRSNRTRRSATVTGSTSPVACSSCTRPGTRPVMSRCYTSRAAC